MATSLDQLKDLSPALAADIAADLIPLELIFSKHGIDPDAGVLLMQHEWFREMVRSAAAEWLSIKSSKQRVQIKGRLALEEAIPTIYALIGDIDVPAAARVAAFKELKDISQVSNETGNAGAGTGLPSVTIYLGDPSGPTVTINGSGAAPQDDSDDVMPGLEILSED